MSLFDSLLIANRGEIACRIIATCRRLGIRTIAVYSDADSNARHVRLADTAVRIGPPPVRESYLSIAAILDAAKATGAQAIHPGYGFLSENAAFAEACTAQDIVFIGPPAGAIRAMGSKAAAKSLMRQAGVPITPGYDGPGQSPAFLQQQADAIGYPVMIKANAGGGGKGMRLVDSSHEFVSALASCRREAAASFGDDSVLIERYLVRPRHIEVQVFADSSGNTVSLFERDCSVQRRHQKVIEEAPPPGLTPAQRAALSKAACDAARAVNYVNAGTIEFLMDRDGSFYFMEMNTRLQVEHPVTEMITGLDLVEWQLRIAAGEPLPLSQDQLTLHGHAIEARIYAEDPAHDFMPSIGKLVHLKPPPQSSGVRIDSGIEQGDTITPFYDPMIAKLIVWDSTRELALRRLVRALGAYQIVGVTSNIDFLHRLVSSPSFTKGDLDTSLIEREKDWLTPLRIPAPGRAIALAALALVLRESIPHQPEHANQSPWQIRDGWRLNATFQRTLVFEEKEFKHTVTVEYRGPVYAITTGENEFIVSGSITTDGALTATLDGQRIHASVIEQHARFHVFLDGRQYILKINDPLDYAASSHTAEGSLLAPMPGRVIAQSVQPGQSVEKGAPLLVLEAMKMELTIYAPANGRVQSFHYAVGDQVTEGTELLHFEPDASPGEDVS